MVPQHSGTERDRTDFRICPRNASNVIRFALVCVLAPSREIEDQAPRSLPQQRGLLAEIVPQRRRRYDRLADSGADLVDPDHNVACGV